MKRLILTVMAVAACLTPAMFGQGYYYNYYLDGTYIGSELDGYPGSGPCGGVNLWNSLNGDYVSGSAPAELLSGTYGTDGVDYNWDFGLSIEYTDPYSGYCDTTTLSFGELLGLHTSYYGLPMYTGGACQYAALACTSGYPTCNSITFSIGFYFAPPCPNIVKTSYLVFNGTCIVGNSFDASTQYPRVCT
jgi:hypothetical protein